MTPTLTRGALPAALLLALTLSISACQPAGERAEPAMTSASDPDAAPNSLTPEEAAAGWELLFDGNSMDRWRVYNRPDIPGQSWSVEDGMMVFTPSDSEEEMPGLDIITKDTFGDFELVLEWMISERGNSGIFYHVIEQPDKALYWSGPEMQILDNENHPDSDQGMAGNRKAGSLYDLIPAAPQNAKPHGEWNQVRIVSDGPRIEHWQNGEMVLSYERWTPEWNDMVAASKFAEHPEFGSAEQGHIALQDHGDVVRFRNLKIRRLTAD